MTLVVPEVGEALMLTAIVSYKALTLKLYSNNYTPVDGSVAGDFTEVAGGGYADIDLSAASWTIGGGAPGVAVYNSFQNFQFTGATNAPGTVYGYYLINSDGVLIWAERFPADDVPFTPVNGSLISVKPRLTLDNA